MLNTRVQAKVAIDAAFYADTALEALATIPDRNTDAGDNHTHGLDLEALVRRTARSIRDRRQQSLRNSIRQSQQRQFRERSWQRSSRRGARVGVVVLAALVLGVFAWSRSRL